MVLRTIVLPMPSSERLSAYARLAVRVGVNVQPGQRLAVTASLAHAPLVRAVAREAYEAGAGYVDVYYADQHIRRAHIAQAAEESLSYTPPWLVTRARRLGEDGGALLVITGTEEPEIFADLDSGRVARARMKELAEASLQLTDGLVNWSIVAFPSEGWAQTVFGEPDVDRLWTAVATAVRLDEPDPVEAWRAHLDRLDARAVALNLRSFDRLHYRGPGTDLVIGLHPESRWQAANDVSAGIKHVANMPTEEVFTTPDARRTEGTVRSTFPLQIPVAGAIVRDLEVRFAAGRVTEVRASSGQHVMQELIATDDGAARLGEVALVDRHSRVRQTGIVFANTLFDENASSHIAVGAAILQAVEWAGELSPDERHTRGVNQSNVHTDFMIGSDELEVDGVTSSGEAVPLLRGGEWQLEG
jgi:aminopeptidase